MATSEQQILAEIGRLGHRLRRCLKDAPGPEVVVTEPDYLAMVDIFAAESLSTTTAVLFAFSENGAVANAALEGFRKNGTRCCDVVESVARRVGDVPSFAMEQALGLIADHHPSIPAGLPLVRLAMASRLQKNGWVGGPLGRALDWYVTWYQSPSARAS